MAPNRVIGKDGKLPWHISDDLKLFKTLTSNNVLVMGYNTYISLPKKGLANRLNIVVTRNHINDHESTENLVFVSSLTDAINYVPDTDPREKFIIGGASLYEQAFSIVDRCYLSLIKCNNIEGDTYFPDVDWYDWRKVSDTEYAEFTLRIMDRA